MKRIASLLICLSIVVSCNTRFEDSWESLRLDYTALNFPSNISNSSMMVYYSGEWTAELVDNNGWISINKTSGLGVTNIEFSFSENLGMSRAATLIIKGGNDIMTIPIIQKAGIANPRIEFISRTEFFPNGSYRITVPFDSNIPSEFFQNAKFTVNDNGNNVDWLTDVLIESNEEVVPDDRKDKFPTGIRRYLSAIVNPNTEGTQRSAAVAVILEDAAKNIYRDSVIFSQSPDAAYISIQETDMINKDGGERSIPVTTNLGMLLSEVNISVEYENDNTQDFISNIRFEGSTLKYSASENLDDQVRKATVLLSYTDLNGTVTTSDSGLHIEQNLFSGSFDDVELKTVNELLAWNSSYGDWKPTDKIKLGADIDLQGQEWISRSFAGTFDGQGHKIYNYHISGDSSVGFFSSLEEGAIVTNVILGSSDGTSYDGQSIISLIPSTTKTKLAGGLAGEVAHNVSISDVVNYARIVAGNDVIGDKLSMGGIIGLTTAAVTLERCSNNASIINSSEFKEIYIGGITGSTTAAVTLNDCTNSGNLQNAGKSTVAYGSNTESGSCMTGGIVGSCTAAANLNRCLNTGRIEDISSSVYITVAGMVAFNKTAAATMNSCINRGYVGCTPTTNNANQLIRLAGFVGHSLIAGTKMIECENYGDVKLENSYQILRNWTGGAAGYCKAVVVSGCKFKSVISRGSVAGGKIGTIIGQDDTTGGVVEKNGVAGTTDGTTLTADNFTSLLVGLKTGSYTTVLANSGNYLITE